MQIDRLNAAIMISGRGSNMQALVRQMMDSVDFPVTFTHVLCDKAEAPGIIWAREHGLATMLVDPTNEHALIRALDSTQAQIICLAGYMRIVPPAVVQRWRGRMLNIHPSLLPKHKGLHAQAKALHAGDTMAGATVHYVTEDLDGGDVIEQESVEITSTDSVESLSAKILQIEHQIYPKAVASVAARLLEGRQ